MTITLNLQKETLLKDLQTLQTIFNAGLPELVKPLSKFMKPLNISSSEFTRDNIQIQVTLDEFALIGTYNEGLN